jgi:hypothetical protein
MPIDSGLNVLLPVLALSDATKAAVAKGLPTCEDLEDVFLALAADKTEVEAMLRKIVDETIVSDIDIRRIMFVFDWFMVNIVDPNFAWSNITRSVYVADKRARAVLNHAPSVSTPISQSTASTVITIDFSSDVLAADAQRQATPAVPGTAATLKPHKLWTSPCMANTRKGNTRQLHSTYLVLASSLAFDVIKFYRKLVAASKPAEIDLMLIPQVRQARKYPNSPWETIHPPGEIMQYVRDLTRSTRLVVPSHSQPLINTKHQIQVTNYL